MTRQTTSKRMIKHPTEIYKNNEKNNRMYNVYRRGLKVDWRVSFRIQICNSLKLKKGNTHFWNKFFRKIKVSTISRLYKTKPNV